MPLKYEATVYVREDGIILERNTGEKDWWVITKPGPTRFYYHPHFQKWVAEDEAKQFNPGHDLEYTLVTQFGRKAEVAMAAFQWVTNF